MAQVVPLTTRMKSLIARNPGCVGEGDWRACPSLRRHDPDQVQGVAARASAPSQPAAAGPPRNARSLRRTVDKGKSITRRLQSPGRSTPSVMAADLGAKWSAV